MTEEGASGSAEFSRRAFFKKMALVGFAIPVVTSFALDGVASAETDWGKDHKYGNQTFHNQKLGNQSFGNQGITNPNVPIPSPLNVPGAGYPSHPRP